MLQPNQVPEGGRRESRWSLMLVALRYRDFRLVWLGSVAEHSGEFMEVATILWLVNEMTHSPLMLTIVGSCRFIPFIFFPIVAGVVADRVNRRSLLMATLLAFALLSACLAVLAATEHMAIWHLVVISLLGGVAMSFNHPARQTIVPNLVSREHLLNAISLDTLSVQMSRAIGMPIGGYLIGAVGVWPIFAIRALGCLLAISWLLLARVPPTPPAARTQAPWHNLAQGFRYLRGNAILLSLVALFAVPYLAQHAYVNLLPIFANDILHVGAVGYGYLQGAPGLGSIICLLGLGLLTYYKSKFRLLIISAIILGIGLLVFSASNWFFLSLTMLVVAGGMGATFSAIDTTLIQRRVPDEVRGRIMSWREIFLGLGPTGSILFGAIALYTGVPFSLGLLGGICLALSLALIILSPRFRSAG